MRFPFVLLDVGETLIGPRRSYGAVYSQTLVELGLDVDEERMNAAIRAVSQELRREIPPGVDRFSHFPGGEEEFWLCFANRSISLATGRELGDGFARSALERLRGAFRQPEAWRVYDDVVPVLDALRDRGCRLAIVSNWDSRLESLLQTLGLRPYFEVLGVSRLERVEKPNPRLFEVVLERLGAGPRQAVHVGNQPELDLEGARAAGVEGRLVDRQGSLERAYGAWADLRPLVEEVTDPGRGPS